MTAMHHNSECGHVGQVKLLRDKYPDLDIEVDGGIGPDNIDQCAQAGANWIVAGSSVFKSKNPTETIVKMKRSIEKFGNGKQDQDLTALPSIDWRLPLLAGITASLFVWIKSR